MSDYEYRRKVEREKLDRALGQAAAQAASSVAGSLMATAFLHPDPTYAGKCMVDSQAWQMNAAMLAGLGLDRGMQVAGNLDGPTDGGRDG